MMRYGTGTVSIGKSFKKLFSTIRYQNLKGQSHENVGELGGSN
jgi:phage-related minor tail protein